MIAHGLYSVNREFPAMIERVGGVWKDTQHRPIVCLMPSSEDENLYWATPMGKRRRDQTQQSRLQYYLHFPDADIRSCYYLTGRTTAQSIFFISDVVPITDAYIDGVYVGADKQHYIIKNPVTVQYLWLTSSKAGLAETQEESYVRKHNASSCSRSGLTGELGDPKKVSERWSVCSSFESMAMTTALSMG